MTVRVGPGDGNDTIEGQADIDKLRFYGANVEREYQRRRKWRPGPVPARRGNVTMDLDDIETFAFNALGGADNIVIGDLSGTDATNVEIDLRGSDGGGDVGVDAVTVNGTDVADTISVAAIRRRGHGVRPAHRGRLRQRGANDRIMLNALGGDDVVEINVTFATAASVTDAAQIEAAIAEAGKLGALRVAVSCAGVGGEPHARQDRQAARSGSVQDGDRRRPRRHDSDAAARGRRHHARPTRSTASAA